MFPCGFKESSPDIVSISVMILLPYTLILSGFVLLVCGIAAPKSEVKKVYPNSNGDLKGS